MKNLLLIIAVVVALVGGMTTALVATPMLQPATVPGTSAPHVVLNQGTSTNWSGYVAATSLTAPASGVASDVAGQWTVPSVTSTDSSAYSAVWVGIGGLEDTTLIQIGTSQDLVHGSPRYAAWWEVGPDLSNEIDMAVSPGDVMRAEVKYIGANEYVMTLDNLTTGDSFNTVQTADARRESAEWIVEAPSAESQVLPLANFGTVEFSAATATLNDHTGSISDDNWQNGAVTMINPGGTATPSGLMADGSGFSVSWSGSTSFSLRPAYPTGFRLSALPW